MQIQLDNVGGGEDLLRQLREEEFIDDALPREANRALLRAGRMGGHHHATEHARRSHRHLWTVVEAAHQRAFWALLDLIWGQVQTRLNERMIEHRVVFTAGHKGETTHVGEHGPGAILSIEPQQGALLWELVCREIATDGREALAQFRSVATVAAVAKRAEPLEAVGLTDDGARPHHLASLAPRVARGTDLIQPAKGRRQVFSLGQGTLSSRLACAIDITLQSHFFGGKRRCPRGTAQVMSAS